MAEIFGASRELMGYVRKRASIVTVEDQPVATGRKEAKRRGSTMEARSSWVDSAKGLGIILVVYGHVARGLSSAGLFKDADLFRLVDSIIYSFHMPLFFFLSGLFFYSSLLKRGRAGLVLNKVDSILYPYVLWSLIQGFVEVADSTMKCDA